MRTPQNLEISARLTPQRSHHKPSRYQLSNAVNEDGTYTDGGWYICEEEEKASGRRELVLRCAQMCPVRNPKYSRNVNFHEENTCLHDAVPNL